MELGVTRLGYRGGDPHPAASDNRLQIVLGYADSRGQWYRDGRRHTGPAGEATTEAAHGVAL